MESIDIYALFLSDKTKIAQQNRCLNILRDDFKQTLHAPTLLYCLNKTGCFAPGYKRND
jgi:stress-induced morphogen